MSESDPRPPVWVGHIEMPTPCLAESHAFMQKLGMRHIAEGETYRILELRAGTHLVLFGSEDVQPGPASFDLMVEDLDATHKGLVELGLAPSEIQPGDIHRSFTIDDPSGHTITFNDSHASDQPL